MFPSLIEIGSKTAEKNSAQTNRQTDTTKIMVTWPWTNFFYLDAYRVHLSLPHDACSARVMSAAWKDAAIPSCRVPSNAVYTMHEPVVQPVVQPVWQPVVSCKRGSHNHKRWSAVADKPASGRSVW